MFSANFLSAPVEDDNAPKQNPIEREITLLTPVLCQRVERALKLQYDNIDKANQLLGEVKGHLALRKSINAYMGLDRNYHLLNAKKSDLELFVARIKHQSNQNMRRPDKE
jgi:hypothetical protein